MADPATPNSVAQAHAPPWSLRIRGLTKIYRGDLVANDHLDLDVHPGEVFGLLGPNGAGKTTLVNQIIGLLMPSSGSIHLGELDLVAQPHQARLLCSHLPQGELPVEAFPLATAGVLMGRIRGGSPEQARRRTEELIETLQLGEWKQQIGSKLSGGVRRLLGFIMAAVVPGRVVILDEPTNDVDPLRRRLLWQEIRNLAAGGAAVLLVTHNVLEAERSVDRLAVVDHGRIVAQGTPASLKKGDRDLLRLDLTLEPRSEGLPELPAFVTKSVAAGRRRMLHLAEADAGSALEWVRGLARSEVVEDYELGPTTLEDAYIRLVSAEGGEPPTEESAVEGGTAR